MLAERPVQLGDAGSPAAVEGLEIATNFTTGQTRWALVTDADAPDGLRAA